jgi:transcriptional regulator with XRE-family HTH domain
MGTPPAQTTQDSLSQDPDAIVGRRIRARRRIRKLSLESLAREAEVSIGLLSQIERGLSSPSISVLRRICTALQIPMNWLFSDADSEAPEEAGLIVRAGRRRTLDFSGRGMVKELLTPDDGGNLQLMIVRLEGHGGSGMEPYSHVGEEAGTVLKGTVELAVDDLVFVLNAGDTFRFDSPRPHRFRNLGEDEAEVLWAVTPPFY